ncbi:response regulator [Desulfosediminicola flagellatus]|uniref:response regulator n=1 Tax=Desulfosediminicola flagellatus TaxID=2569541 RepID=UPI0010ABC4FC|nr:response regulator [Desulfosediminicola flagellatus]
MEKVVLIVEDEVLVGMMLAKKIAEYGFTVCDVVSTGEEAVEVALQRNPGVVLMDVSLGGRLDGIEAAAIIRETMPLPVIFFTGYNQDKKLLQRAGKLHPIAVLDKLGPIESVIAALEQAFE